MSAWNCCRMCLGEQNLCPIFVFVHYHEKYSNVILNTTGIKVELNDNLPQQMCSPCINFINDSYIFRKKCEETQKHLLDQLNNKPFDIKNESKSFKSENGACIDISEFLDDDFKDEDNIPLEEYQYIYSVEKLVERQQGVDECNGTEEKSVATVFDKLKKNEKPVRRKIRKKVNLDGDTKQKVKPKSERVKEEIECEYCHKILTSKLSLRNHYKIHTGFDVVCEHCGKKFITRRLLLMHCRAKHGYEKTDKCSFCDYRASNAEQVKIHERLHTGEKPYVCKECSAGFHRKSSYLQHVAIHLPEKTVQCDQCPARFKSVTLMRIHKNRHRAPQYTFKCRVCDNSFARRRNVARHLQRIHGLQPEHQHIDRLKIS